MRLCSFLDYQCDLCIYVSPAGIECHVAADRRVTEPDPPPPLPSLAADDYEWSEWRRLSSAYGKALSQTETQEIRGLRDGEHRTCKTWATVQVYVAEVAADGYRVPDWVVAAIDAEVHRQRPVMETLR